MSNFRQVAWVILGCVLSGCASFPAGTHWGHSRLPVDQVDEGVGEMAKVCAYEHGDRLIVSGSVWTPHVKAPAHIDIRLIAGDGKIVAERQEQIDPARSSVAHQCRYTYVTSFPIAQVKRAARLQVVYHDVPH